MLEVITLDAARRAVEEIVRGLEGSVSADAQSPSGRIAAEDVLSEVDVPSFDRSLVDGFAVKSFDTFGCSDALPAVLRLTGEIMMGEDNERTISEGECMRIPTGGRLPAGADCALMFEYTEEPGDGTVCVLKPCAPFENVMSTGADIKRGQLLFKRGHMFSAKDTGVLAAAGITAVAVRRRPVVCVISTGDELVPASVKPKGSQVRDINTPLLSACVKEYGCDVYSGGIIKDDAGELLTALKTALEKCDAVIVSGGSSVGQRDALYDTLALLGEVVFHGIAVKPGKPTMLARVEGKPVLGLAGHPLAAFFMFKELAAPLLCGLSGTVRRESTVTARAARNIPSNHGREELIPVRLDNGIFEPLVSKSGAMCVLACAHGYIKIPRASEGVFEGEQKQVILF